MNVLGDAVLTGIPEGNILMGADRNIGGIRERIGVLPQSFNAFDLLTVRENLLYFAGLYERHRGHRPADRRDEPGRQTGRAASGTCPAA